MKKDYPVSNSLIRYEIRILIDSNLCETVTTSSTTNHMHAAIVEITLEPSLCSPTGKVQGRWKQGTRECRNSLIKFAINQAFFEKGIMISREGRYDRRLRCLGMFRSFLSYKRPITAYFESALRRKQV